MTKQIAIEEWIERGAVELASPVKGWSLLWKAHAPFSNEWRNYLIVNHAPRRRRTDKRSYHVAHNGNRMAVNKCSQPLVAEHQHLAEMFDHAMACHAFELEMVDV